MWSWERESQLDAQRIGAERDEQGPSRRGASQTRRAQTFSSRLACWGRRCAGCLGGRFGRGRGLGFGGGTGRCNISTWRYHLWIGGPYVVQTQRRPEAGSRSSRRMRAQRSPRRGGQDWAHRRGLSRSRTTFGTERVPLLQLLGVPDTSSAHKEEPVVSRRGQFRSSQKNGDEIGASNGGDVIPWLGACPCSHGPEPLKCPATPRPQTATASCCRRDIFLI